MNQKELAIKLRREGYSYGYIVSIVGLSKSTLSHHLSSIKYIPNKETVRAIGLARAESAKTKAKQKRDSINSAKEEALLEMGEVSSRDLFMLGVGIYIGEGSKTQEIVRVVNADHRVISLFIKWLKLQGLKSKNIAIRLHLYPDTNIGRAEAFWSKKTGLPESCFQKPCIDYRAKKDRRRSGLHKNGTAHVTVRAGGEKKFGVHLSRKISAWMEEVLE